jgi:predicted GNAT family acetyltransferase
MAKYEAIELINNESIHNFELVVDGYRSFIDYKQKGDKLYLIHTEVAAELKGKGVAEALVEKALSYMETNGLKLVPLCVYIQQFLKRHPEWNRLLA